MIPPVRGTSRRNTLQRRLRGLILTTSALALVLASGAFLAYDYVSFRRSMQDRLLALTELMATQTSAALAFNDPRVASEMLGTLTAAPHIVSAAIYTKSGTLLTKYLRTDFHDTHVLAAPPADGAHFDGG
ncbi:MAG TPA: CHASE sensor domain-containing protein, partial [Planctomycetota bacterium]|nr:CHASE sensor domain-containing protein [Planctomycetota bacterium]